MDFDKLKRKMQTLKTLVIGDIVVDKYYFSDVERISPEAPIPVARLKRVERRPGGAANVALNLSRLGVKTSLFGLLGKDREKEGISFILKNEKINLKNISPKKFSTIVKTRIISKGNQLLRLDLERKDFKLDKEEENEAIKQIKKLIKKVDLVIISDYQKGSINQKIIDFVKKQKKYVSIDTKSQKLNLEGVNLVKPNFLEATQLTKFFGNNKEYKNEDFDLEEMGMFLREKIKANLLITRGEKGVTYVGDEIIHNKIPVSEVYDITGAGDTCISIFSILDYLDIEKKKALSLTNKAAKITLAHLGNYCPTIFEIESEDGGRNPKILYKEDLKHKVAELKKQKKKIVFTNGCFDILHKGHVAYLKKAREFGDILIVGLNSDKSIRKLKGSERPIIDEDSRVFVLSHLDQVNYVVMFDDLNPSSLIRIIKPEVYVKGGNYKREDVPEAKMTESLGGRFETTPFYGGFSTTSIVERIKKTNNF